MAKNNKEYSRVIPVWKFIFLTFVTFGIYEICWFYKNWKFFKEKDKLDISPFWRAIFAPFFIHGLFKKILELTKKEGYRESFSAGWLTSYWIIISYLWKLPDPYWLISFLSFLPLISPLQAMNFYWNKKKPNLPMKSFSWWQILLIILGILVFMLALIGTFMPEI